MRNMILNFGSKFFRKASVSFLLLTLATSQMVNSQKVKDYVLEVNYQAVPPFPLYVKEVKYNFYVKEQYIDNSNQIMTEEFSSFTSSLRKTFYELNLPSSSFFRQLRKKADDEYKCILEIGLATLERKNLKSVSRQPLVPTEPVVNAMAIELTYLLPFNVIMKNNKDSIICDENNNHKKSVSFIFPDDFQDAIPNYRDFVSQQQVEALYLKNVVNIDKRAKDKIIAKNLLEFSKILKKRHEELAGELRFPFYYLKERKVEYPSFDSALTIMKLVCDSIKLNFKAKNYKNWHTSFVKQQTQVVDKIINRLSAEYKVKLEKGEMDKELIEEIVFGLIKNKYAVLLLQNRYEEALAEIEVYLMMGKFHKELSKIYLEKIQDYFKEEKRRYERNKKQYNWQ